MERLQGARALITGGARGIGLALARRLAREGVRLVLTDSDLAAALEAARALAADGADVHPYALDVTRRDQLEDLRDRLQREVGAVQILVNNAGVVHGGPFLQVPLERHLNTYGVNILGLVAATYVFLPQLLEQPEAHIVNLASASGLIGLPYGSTYASSKWAVIGFSESLRQELRLLGRGEVHVTTVCPSYVATGLFEGARPPRLTRLLTPERLADQIVSAVKKDKALLLTPWLVRITPAARAVLPTWAWDRLNQLLGVHTSMEDWRGRREGPA